MQAFKDWSSNDPLSPLHIACQNVFRWIVYALTNPLLRSRVVEEFDILADRPTQLSFIQNEHVIETLTPDTADEPFTNRVACGARTGVLITSIRPAIHRLPGQDRPVRM